MLRASTHRPPSFHKSNKYTNLPIYPFGGKREHNAANCLGANDLRVDSYQLQLTESNCQARSISPS